MLKRCKSLYKDMSQKHTHTHACMHAHTHTHTHRTHTPYLKMTHIAHAMTRCSLLAALRLLRCHATLLSAKSWQRVSERASRRVTAAQSTNSTDSATDSRSGTAESTTHCVLSMGHA